MDKEQIKSLCYIKSQAERLIYNADEISMREEPEFLNLTLMEIKEACENILHEIKEFER